jgi:hypothetical protein
VDDSELRRLTPPFSGPSSVCPSYTLYTHTSVPRVVHWYVYMCMYMSTDDESEDRGVHEIKIEVLR